MKPPTKPKLQAHSPSSLRVRSLSECVGASWFASTNELLLRFIKSLQATKQSSFTNYPSRSFYKYWENLSTANAEQGDCFVDAATIGIIQSDFQSKLRLAMTKCCAYDVICDFTFSNKFCEG